MEIVEEIKKRARQLLSYRNEQPCKEMWIAWDEGEEGTELINLLNMLDVSDSLDDEFRGEI